LPIDETPAEKTGPPETEIVAPVASVAWESVMLFVPAKTILVPLTPVFPDVLPPVDTPTEKDAAPGAGAEIETCPPSCESVMFGPPASVTVPEERSAYPAPAEVEFPARVRLNALCVCTDWEAEMRHPLLEAATEMIPSPAIESVLASYVPDEVPCVLEIAYTEPAWFVWATATGAEMTHPELEAATLTAPDPAMLNVRASYVPLEVPKVLEEAYTDPACTDWLALIRQPLFDAATVTIPAPAMDRVRASYVPDDVPEVFEIA